MHTDYQSPVIRWYRDCQQQASRHEMLERIEAAERLIANIDAEASYPAADVLSKIDGRPLPEAGNRKLSGTDLLNDLRLLVEDMSDMVELAADAVGEQVFTVEELAKQFNVSTKTISRWRALGLVSRRLVFDGRKRVGFLRSSVDRFVKNNAERVERGARFSQLTDDQREEFIDRAREMAQAGQGQGEIARQLAERTGRSVETIRAALRNYDTEHPDVAIFPAGSGPLTEVQKTNIFLELTAGVCPSRSSAGTTTAPRRPSTA